MSRTKVFWIVASVILVIALVLVIMAGSSSQTSLPLCSQTSLSSLPELTTSSDRCLVQSNLTDLWYTEVNNQTYVLSPVQTSTESICQGDSTCESTVTSTTCTGIVPMAKLGTVRYYPFILGCGVCDSCS